MPFVLSVLLPMRGKIVRFSGGITLGFLTAGVAAAAVLAMASEHLRLPSALYVSKAAPKSSPNGFSQKFEEEYVLDEEDRTLCLLLEAFPGISHETLAIAYARANRDPNKAAEILSAETGTNDNLSTQSSDFFLNWEPPNHEDNKGVHSDDFSSGEADTLQLKNGHGDFAGASVWRDSPILANHSRPPEASSDSVVNPLLPEEDGDRVVSVASQQKNKITRTNKPPNWGGRNCSSTAPKLSAVAGSVSNRMQRRPSGSLANFNCSELGDGLYSEKIVKKKNKAGNGVAGEEDRRRAAEDFLHSMLGGDFGIDLVRDVLAHYEGDTEKALETLLNIGSTSSGFDYSRDVVNAVGPLCEGDKEKNLETLPNIRSTSSGFDYSIDAVSAVSPVLSALSLGAQNVENGEIIQVPGPFRQDFQDLQHLADMEPVNEAFIDNLPSKEQSHRIQLEMLIEDFPTVEECSLAQVLQAAELSYEGALEILKDSGMTPVGLQNSKPKLDPNEVLQALFRTGSEPPATTAGPFDEPLVTVPTEVPWSVVAAKPRNSRNTQVQAQKFRSNEDGELEEYNEYYRQRASANEHWETMKMYMKEANAAYNKGDRARAGLLSEKGAKFKEHARAASNRASQNIFNVRNKRLPNNIAIDLHSQHVAEALSLLQLHLRTLSQIPSVNGLIVITGQGSHSAGGQAKIKPAITRYLDKKQVPWTQENPGCIFIKMSDVRSDADQRDVESYTDSE